MAVLCLGSVVVAQNTDESLFSTVRPEVMVLVREHDTGAEEVEVTVLAADYPEELLLEQCVKVGQYVGMEVRGLGASKESIDPANSKLTFLRANFATNGLIDSRERIVRLQPIARAFAGAPKPFTLTGLSVAFENETPASTMLKKFILEGKVEVEGRVSEAPAGIEYRIKLISQNPDEIEIPETEPIEPESARIEQRPRELGTVFWIVFSVAGVAIVALVYLALLKIGRNSRMRQP